MNEQKAVEKAQAAHDKAVQALERTTAEIETATEQIHLADPEGNEIGKLAADRAAMTAKAEALQHRVAQRAEELAEAREALAAAQHEAEIKEMNAAREQAKAINDEIVTEIEAFATRILEHAGNCDQAARKASTLHWQHQRKAGNTETEVFMRRGLAVLDHAGVAAGVTAIFERAIQKLRRAQLQEQRAKIA